MTFKIFSKKHKENIGKAKTIHGMSYSPFYTVFYGAKIRCNNSNNKDYPHYGGRGIKFEWKSFEDFRNDMYDSYEIGLTLERINVNGNYSRENCKWASRKEQANNRTNSRMIEYKGETKTISQWAETLRIDRHLIHSRLRYGWSVERAFNERKRYGF